MMKATTDKMDPIQARMLKGRRIAKMFTISTIIIVGLTAMIYPDLFRSDLKAPTAEEREKSKAERKKNQVKKKKRDRLTKEDVRKLAKLRISKAEERIRIALRKLELQIIEAETAEREMTAIFREDPKLMRGLKRLIKVQIDKAQEEAYSYGRSVNRNSPEFMKTVDISIELTSFTRALRIASKNKDLNTLLEKSEQTLKAIERISKSHDLPVNLSRKIKSVIQNIKAIQSNDKSLAVRGYAEPEDHPLSSAQRSQFDKTIQPMSLAKLHELSQEMSEHYTNLIADIEAAELAKEAGITLPEVIEQMAHNPFDKDDFQKELSQSMPANTDELEALTNSLNEAVRSAERALKEDENSDGSENSADAKATSNDKQDGT